MSIGYRNYVIRAQKAAESEAKRSQNIKGYTACKKNGDRGEFCVIAEAKKFIEHGGRVIRNSDCVVVFKV